MWKLRTGCSRVLGRAWSSIAAACLVRWTFVLGFAFAYVAATSAPYFHVAGARDPGTPADRAAASSHDFHRCSPTVIPSPRGEGAGFSSPCGAPVDDPGAPAHDPSSCPTCLWAAAGGAAAATAEAPSLECRPLPTGESCRKPSDETPPSRRAERRWARAPPARLPS